MPRIPLVDVKAQYAPLLPQLNDRLAEVLDAGVFILGPNVKAFEEEAAALQGKLCLERFSKLSHPPC